MLGVERVIPVRFYVLDKSGETACATKPTSADAFRALHEANAMFRPTGAQFSFQRLDVYPVPSFAKLSTVDYLSYSAVRPQLKQLDPSWDDSTRTDGKSSYAWMEELLTRLPHTTLNILVACSLPPSIVGGAPHAFNPPSYRIFFTHASIKGTSSVLYAHNNSTLAHELGHYLGLPHTFEENPSNLDAWDMVYGAPGGGSVRFFSSRADRAAYTGTVKLIDNNLTGGDCTSFIDLATCEIKCNLEGTLYDTSALGMRSVLFKDPASGMFGSNLMAYLHSDDNCAHHFSASQIERVRAALRASSGDRVLLGRQTFAAKSRSLDFDGDGKRDIAYYRHTDKSCHVRRGSTGAEQVFTIAAADATQGDIPVPGDYDGDGWTDCAVFRPGTATRWFWVSSRTGTAGSSTFGELGDIPLPGVRMKSEAPGYGLYAVYRPSTGQTWWWTRAGYAVNRSFDAGPASELVFADYDGDGYTDIALWNPQALGGSSTQARFYISGSRGDYATHTFHNFGLTNDVPLGAVEKNGNSTKDFALFRPSNGTWYYLLDPTATPGNSARMFGVSGDLPLAGYDFDADGTHDEVVYRPRERSFYLGAGATGQVVVGLSGDIPFLAPDRNGDGKPELWLHRPTGHPAGNYFEIVSSGGGYPAYTAMQFGNFSEDVPLN